MKKFGRFEFKATEPVEVYEGDRMELQHGHVTILKGVGLGSEEETVAIVRLDQGQTMREIREPETKTKRESKRKTL